MQQESPFNSVPVSVLVLVFIIVGVEIAITLGNAGIIGGPTAVGWRLDWIDQFAVSPAVIDRIFGLGDLSYYMTRRLVGYSFINAGWVPVIFASAMLLALGKFIGESWKPLSILMTFVVAGIVGGLVFGIVTPQNMPLFGSFPAVYGLIGAYSYLRWLELQHSGNNKWKAFGLITFVVLIQIVWGLILKLLTAFGFFEADPSAIMIYFGIASLSGFVTGLVLSPILGPGGWATFVARLRQR